MAGLAAPILWILRPLGALIGAVLAVCRVLAVAALAIMVGVILWQIVLRYGFNQAPNWSEEAARFGMLWMTGLMAPVAYRQGGFVAIDMAERALPPRGAAVLVLLLAAASLTVLVYALPLGSAHVQSGCLFKSSTLWLPFTFEFALPLPGGLDLTLCTRASPSIGFEAGWTKMPLAVMYASLYVGAILLTAVCVELVLRSLAALLGAADDLRPVAPTDAPVAE